MADAQLSRLGNHYSSTRHGTPNPNPTRFTLLMCLSILALFLCSLFLWSAHLHSPHSNPSHLQVIPFQSSSTLSSSSSSSSLGVACPTLPPPPPSPLPKKNLKKLISSSTSSSSSSSCNPSTTTSTPPLRLYMYPMPREFHFGMIEDLKTNNGPVSIWPSNTSLAPRYLGGLNLQHSPEYWLTLDLLTRPNNSAASCNGSSVIRVDKRSDADLFFVPFFSSLSLNRYSKGAAEAAGSGDRNVELQKRLVRYLLKQSAWAAYGGRDHIIMMHHPNSLHVVRQHLCSALFVVSDFGRYPAEVANVSKDVVAPYRHVIPTYSPDQSSFLSRTTLLFFQGAFVRKEGGIIRQQLYELLKDKPGVHFVAGNTQRDGIRSATIGMRESKFCLHMAGDTPSSNRLFDAIVSHCVPVVVSDDIELPFEDVLDYSRFCIFVRATDATRKGFLLKLLQDINETQWRRMWLRLREVDHMFEYQHPALPDDAVHNTWAAIARKLPTIRQSLHKTKRYATSSPNLVTTKRGSA